MHKFAGVKKRTKKLIQGVKKLQTPLYIVSHTDKLLISDR